MTKKKAVIEKAPPTDKELEEFHIKCVTIAIQIRKRIGRKWFTVRDLVNMTNTTTMSNDQRKDALDAQKTEMTKRIEALKMVGLIKEKKMGKKLKYRTDLTAIDKFLQEKKKEESNA